MSAEITATAIIPSFTYRDAPRAITFLCEAFGFERHTVYEGANGGIDHAQLRLGRDFIMLGSAKNDEAVSTRSSTYVVLERDDDVDAHCARARAAGAKIVRELDSPDYGGRGYSAEDPEGYQWSFGSYSPEAT